MQRIVLVVALSALLISGCGGGTHNLQKGIENYERTDYAGAMSQLSVLSTSERSLNQRNLVRYLVYRGLTHYRLGDRTSALSYLTRGREALARGSATWVRADLVAEMDKALADLRDDPGAGPPGEPPPPPATPLPPSTGEALVPIKPHPTGEAPPAKPEPTNAGPAPVKTAGPAPAKTAAAAPVKTSSPPTRTSPAVQSTSPK